MTAPPSTLPGARRILCVRLDGMGDVLMTSPAMRALKHSAPAAELTLLASSAGAAIARHIPEVDRVIAFDAPWMKAGAEARPDEAASLVAQLASHRFDLAVIFTMRTQCPLPAALLCHLAGIPARIARSADKPYGLLTHWLPEHEPAHVEHDVERQLSLVRSIGAGVDDDRLSIRVEKRARSTVVADLGAAGIDPARPWCLLHPGATASSRRYPPPLFAEAARQLGAEYGIPVVVAGGPGDVELAQNVAAGGRLPNFAGRWNLGELTAAIALAPVVLCNNSLPAHIAAATGTPVADLYALTNPEHTPWRTDHVLLSHDVECRWCYRSECPEGHHRCLVLVTPAEVAGAVARLLERSRNQPGTLAAEIDFAPAR